MNDSTIKPIDEPIIKPCSGKTYMTDAEQEVRLDTIYKVLRYTIREAPENVGIYGEITDAEVEKLAESMKKHGILEPLVLTLDFILVSGHRRFRAARLAGIERLPVRFTNFRHAAY